MKRLHPPVPRPLTHIYSQIANLYTFKLLCCVQQFSRVQLFVTPWTAACQAPLPMRFSRQEYQSGLSCLPPGDLPRPGIEPRSSELQVDSLPTEPPGRPELWQFISQQQKPNTDLYTIPQNLCFSKQYGLYKLTGATLTKYHKPGGLNSGIYCLTVLEAENLRARCKRENLLHMSLQTSGGFLRNLWHPWFLEASPQSLPSYSYGVFPVCMSVFKFLLLIRTLFISDGDSFNSA